MIFPSSFFPTSNLMFAPSHVGPRWSEWCDFGTLALERLWLRTCRLKSLAICMLEIMVYNGIMDAFTMIFIEIQFTDWHHRDWLRPWEFDYSMAQGGPSLLYLAQLLLLPQGRLASSTDNSWIIKPCSRAGCFRPRALRCPSALLNRNRMGHFTFPISLVLQVTSKVIAVRCSDLQNIACFQCCVKKNP